jgi:hypothetical protein
LYRQEKIQVPHPPKGWRKGTFPDDAMLVYFGARSLF